VEAGMDGEVSFVSRLCMAAASVWAHLSKVVARVSSSRTCTIVEGLGIS